MKELIIKNCKGINVVDSREVAEMIGKKHSHLMRDIQSYEKVISENPKLDSQNFFIRDNYKVEGNNKTYDCYLLTKQGCEMVANKMTGEKGIIFTAEYVQAFNKMEQSVPQLSKELQAIFVLDNRTVEIEKRIDNIENNLPLLGVDCDEVTKTVHGVGVRLLGSKNSNAYKDKSLRRRVYTDIYGELKRQFQVRSYKAIKRCELSKAIDVINNYKLPLALDSEIFQVNNQMSMEVS
ncbi:Rha family transcriptional regulator [Clostridium sp. HCP1S3_B4]|uniref:Rha family transcriptional regulator n=1 Tax=Clostridia TaxID=186801 RepID=UPI002A91A344|nr:ORF6C domain-containing protein [Terrisporobacter sp.]MDY6153089.1 ORF6C domain-containing protein [Terrisporobacter sp.]